MSKINVLIEIADKRPDSFAMHRSAMGSEVESTTQSEDLGKSLAKLGLDIQGDFAPVPMFTKDSSEKAVASLSFSDFASPSVNADASSDTHVICAHIDHSNLDKLAKHEDVAAVWPNAKMTLFGNGDGDIAPPTDIEILFGWPSSRGGLDCRPFRDGVDIATIRDRLGVQSVWEDGFHGQNIVVGIIDEGVNGDVYPVIGGSDLSQIRPPGAAPITSHGSMCAADILVAAPAAQLYDYPFLGVPDSGGMLQMFQLVLEQRRQDGTPHLTNNSYGFTGVPPQSEAPRHPIWDRNHVQHRKVLEVIASGAAAFFAAGNCGQECPSGNCHSSGIGPERSIHASNSLDEVVTVAAVNAHHQRVGYSSQGPGMFATDKPDIASYTHLFGNFGPGRPGGFAQPYDNGTSAATPVAAGVAALLLCAFPDLTAPELKDALIAGAMSIGPIGFDHDHGHGIVNAAASYNILSNSQIMMV